MSAAAFCRCGRESSSPFVDVDPLSDEETVLTVIRDINGLSRDEFGVTRVSLGAFRREDIEAKKPGKTVSLMRESATHRDELIRRAAFLTRETKWKSDPVVAHAKTHTLRNIVSEHFPKCLCVFADPVSQVQADADGDPLGEYCGHASLKKHCDFQGKNNKLAWVNLVSDLAEAFDLAFHLCSNAPVILEV